MAIWIVGDHSVYKCGDPWHAGFFVHSYRQKSQPFDVLCSDHDLLVWGHLVASPSIQIREF